MTPIKAVVRNGRIETDEPLNLPEGTELQVVLSHPDFDHEDGRDNSPEAIARWLAWADSLEPLIFTENERAAWEADRKARKDWEKANFDDYSAKLRKEWE